LQKDGSFFGPDLNGQRVVIVDDVVHSGRRLRDAAEKVRSEGGDVVGFACLIDRSAGRFSHSDVSDIRMELGAPLWSAFQTDME
jgi:orotate phosphoribosyltransferase